MSKIFETVSKDKGKDEQWGSDDEVIKDWYSSMSKSVRENKNNDYLTVFRDHHSVD